MKDKEFELRVKKKSLIKERSHLVQICWPTAGGGLALLVVKMFVDKFVQSFVNMFDGTNAGAVVFGIVCGVLAFITIITFLVIVKVLFREDDLFDRVIKFLGSVKSYKGRQKAIAKPSQYKLLRVTEVLFSAKTQKTVFKQSMADWDEEIYEAIDKSKNAKLFMINLRNSYAFISAMIMKSPIGDLFEFVVKIALKVAK